MEDVSGFGSRLKALRNEAGFTLAQLAERAGMHSQAIVKLERGEREPAWATVLTLAKALGVSCEAFVGTEGEREPEPEPPKRGRPSKQPPATPTPLAAPSPQAGATGGKGKGGSGKKRKGK